MSSGLVESGQRCRQMMGGVVMITGQSKNDALSILGLT